MTRRFATRLGWWLQGVGRHGPSTTWWFRWGPYRWGVALWEWSQRQGPVRQVWLDEPRRDDSDA